MKDQNLGCRLEGSATGQDLPTPHVQTPERLTTVPPGAECCWKAGDLGCEKRMLLGPMAWGPGACDTLAKPGAGMGNNPAAPVAIIPPAGNPVMLAGPD